MSSHKARLAQFADIVKSAGMAGHSMQKKLAEIVADNDLTPHEIDRIAEIANRDLQLSLYKSAADKRFKFELIDPAPLKAAALKHAQSSQIGAPSHAQKVASILPEKGGDPFAVPYRESEPLSLFEQPMNMKTAAEMEVVDIRKTTLALDQKRAEYELVLNSGRALAMKIAAQAERTYSKSVQAAVDLVVGGITLPSLYTAVAAAVGGSGASDEDRKSADMLMLLIIKGVKERGVPNHRLGFRHRGNIELLDSLSPDDLLTLCKRSTGRIHEHDIPMPLVKKAEYLKSTHDELDPEVCDTGVVAQPYLDEKYVDNLPGGKPLVINGENQFVIGVQDLIGDQSRMRRCHAANEYIGLKLKQIESMLYGLKAAHKVAEEKVATFGPPPKPGLGLVGTLAHPAMTNAVGLAGLASMAAPMLMSSSDDERRRKTGGMMDLLTAGSNVYQAAGIAQNLMQKKSPEQKMNERLKSSNAKLEVEEEHKEAFAPLLAALASPALTNAVGIAGLGLTAKSMMSPSAPAAPKPPAAPAQPKVQQSV